VRRTKIIVSDLHLAAGYGRQGNRLEDFDQDEAFGALMAHLLAECKKWDDELEIIFAGDTFEFLQVPALEYSENFDPKREYPTSCYAASDEAASRRKMDLIIQGHPVFFKALRDIMAYPRGRICFIKGNHDVNLHWREVQTLIRAALGAVQARDRLTFEERCLSREGLYVEHGNQYLEWINRWPDFEQPHDPSNPRELYLPVGSRFVFEFFSRMERQYYWMDGIKPITALIWYLFAIDYGNALRALKALVRQLPSLIWGSLRTGYALSEAVQAQDQVLQTLDDERRMSTLDISLSERSKFYNQVDIALDLYGVERSGGPLARFGVYGHTVLPRGRDEQRAQRERLARVAEVKRIQEGARVIVFGHVHEPVQVELENGATYLNAGSWTWCRDMSDASHAEWLELFKDPESFMQSRRLTYVRVDYDDANVPHAQLYAFELERAPQQTLWQRFRDWLSSREE
jgi:UDP-2,3-diacylglucosamine pyrophosphatase LpxH